MLFDIGVLVGSNTFRFYEFKALGKIKLSKDIIIHLKGEIKDFSVD